jgi:ribosome-interacting GTPase 1
LLAEIEESRVRSSALNRDSIEVRHEGAAQIALVGPPNVGKSSILQALSEIQIKTGDYPFTTLRPIPALTRIGGVLVQPRRDPRADRRRDRDRGGGKALLGVLRSADAIVYCTRPTPTPTSSGPLRGRLPSPASTSPPSSPRPAPTRPRRVRSNASKPRFRTSRSSRCR